MQEMSQICHLVVLYNSITDIILYLFFAYCAVEKYKSEADFFIFLFFKNSVDIQILFFKFKSLTIDSPHFS